MEFTDLSPADRAIFERSARSIGLQVALLSLCMIVVGGILVSFAAWWEWSHSSSVEWAELAFDVALFSVLAVVVSGLAAFWFARRATRPLADALTRQRNFVADASHELRTPLSILYARVQQLSALVRRDERLKPVVAELKTDTQQMIALVEELLELATVPEVVAEPVRLDDVLSVIEADGTVAATAKSITLSVSPSKATVMVPEVALRRALSALLDNALKHAPEGGWVDITVLTAGSDVEIRVVDNGPGISGIDPARVFERFARGSGGSHGIGLALVQDTIARAGGSVSVEKTGPDGTTFLIRLPQGRPA